MNNQTSSKNGQQCQSAFEQNLEKLRSFLEANNRFPARHEEAQLCIWANRIRDKYKKGFLDRKQIEQLSAMGFIWDMREWHWQRNASEVQQLLLQKHIPSSASHPILYAWLRNSLDCLEKNVLAADKKAIMEEIKMALDHLHSFPLKLSPIARRVKELVWEDRFRELVNFRKLHTKCWPRLNSGNSVERKLAKWCAAIRSQRSKNALCDYWVQKLKSINFNMLAMNFVYSLIQDI
jgi:hypothetical protein